MISPALTLLRTVGDELGLAPSQFEGAHLPASPVPLSSRLSTGDLAWASVSAVVCAAGLDIASLDADRIATAYRSDRFLTIDGTPPTVWSPSSGFWRTADRWIRTHGNYPHHAIGLRAGLRLGTDADAAEIAHALSSRSSADAAASITAAGGPAVVVSAEDPSTDAALRRTPLLGVNRIDDAPPIRPTPRSDRSAPLAGIRVLDLTRVIAGPVCSRTLALLGADVLRIDPPHLPEPEWQHLDTGHGKRSTLLDARSERMHELLDAADVVVLGYRPAALERLGISPEHLAERHPGLLIAQLSAWGIEHPDRAGFDSLVQAESGIALIESLDGTTPGALPAQALDHSAGYLLAAAVVTMLARREADPGTRLVRTSLRRIAAELLGMPRGEAPAPARILDPARHTAKFTVSGHEVVTVRPALPGLDFAAPRPWGEDQPRW